MKTQNPFTGRSSGSLANVTASTYCGQNILKSKPLEVRNPQSPKQLNVRAVLAQAAAAAKSLYGCSAIAKRSARTGRQTSKTARTALLKAIMATRSGVAPNTQLNPLGIKLSGNGIAQTTLISAELDHSAKDATLVWSTVIPTGGAASDIGYAVIVNLNSGQALQSSTSALRSAGTLVFSIDSSFINEDDFYAAFICFASADGLTYDSIDSIAANIV